MPSSRLDSHRNSVQFGMVERFTAFTATIFIAVGTGGPVPTDTDTSISEGVARPFKHRNTDTRRYQVSTFWNRYRYTDISEDLFSIIKKTYKFTKPQIPQIQIRRYRQAVTSYQPASYQPATYQPCGAIFSGEGDTGRYQKDTKRYDKILKDIRDIRYANPDRIGCRYRYVQIFQIQIRRYRRGSADHYGAWENQNFRSAVKHEAKNSCGTSFWSSFFQLWEQFG